MDSLGGCTWVFLCFQKFVNFRPLLRFFFSQMKLNITSFHSIDLLLGSRVCWVGFLFGCFSGLCFFGWVIFFKSDAVLLHTFHTSLLFHNFHYGTDLSHRGLLWYQMCWNVLSVCNNKISHMKPAYFFLVSGCAQAAECDIVVGCSSCCWWNSYTSPVALSAPLCSDSFSFQKCKIEVVGCGRERRWGEPAGFLIDVELRNVC